MLILDSSLILQTKMLQVEKKSVFSSKSVPPHLFITFSDIISYVALD